jgi:hypothetical protein
MLKVPVRQITEVHIEKRIGMTSTSIKRYKRYKVGGMNPLNPSTSQRASG